MSRKDVTDTLRTIVWYELIRTGLDLKMASAYQIEAEINLRLEKRGVKPQNRWVKYSTGKNVPRIALVNDVERIVHKSKRVLEHPLWEALRNDFDVLKHANRLLCKLKLEIQSLIFDFRTDERKKITHGLLGRLDDHLNDESGLDVLTCLIIFLREAHAKRDLDTANLVGQHLYDTSVVLFSAGFFQPIEQQLLGILQERIFPLTGHGDEAIIFRSNVFLDIVGNLQEIILFHEHSKGSNFSTAEKIIYLKKLVKFGQLNLTPDSIFWESKLDRYPSLRNLKRCT